MSIKQIATRVFGRTVLKVQKYSPEILTGLGVVGMVGSTVLAVKATPNAQAIIKTTQSVLEDTKLDFEQNKDGSYSESTYRKHIAQIYVAGGLELTKQYGPAISLGAASAVSIISAHGIMRKRNAALVAGYNLLEKAFVQYRQRVDEEIGADRELELYHGLETEEVHDTKAGTVTKTTTKDPNAYSPYARFFDELSPNWEKEAEYNLLFIRAQQNFANDLLHARGHLFLNEVYDSLGIPRTKAGQIVGWVISKDGDNFVDFGVYAQENDRARAFVNGVEKGILLDFNVDGIVYDLI